LDPGLVDAEAVTVPCRDFVFPHETKIVGTAGADRLVGTSGADIIVAGRGDDQIWGRGATI
jgi:hypothetical protein